MNRLPLIALATALELSSQGCKKEKKPADQGVAAAPTQAGQPEEKAGGAGPGGAAGAAGAAGGATEAGAPAEKPATAGPEVKSPVAEDLAAYTEDLPGKGPLTATLETSMGTIHCELYDKGAPLTVANFVGLARGKLPFKDPVTGKIETRPYYDGTVFHRVIPEFMIQGGDPTATGEGGPGYEFATEVSSDLKHTPGTLSMANAGPNTNGSQFFITEGTQSRLDGKYNVFGKCKELEVVKKIARVTTTEQPGDPNREKSRPVDPVKLIKVTISR